MSIVKVQGNASGTGIFTVASPNSNTDRTLTLPDNTGTLVSTGSTAGVTQAMLASGVAGNGPAFRAKRSTTFAVSANTWTKIAFNVEDFDTNNCYDSSTNYRFTPTAAGYYQLNQNINVNSAVSIIYLSFYKNGTSYSLVSAPATSSSGVSNSTLVYLNGSTDYVEAYCYFASAASIDANDYSSFSASMVRAA